MADNSLTTTPGGGTQATTQSPQAAGAANNGNSANSGGIQPGTSSDLLRSQNGIELKPTPLTTVDLRTAKSGSTQAATPPNHHHINPILGVFSIGLFVLAIVLFWLTSRSVKSTT